MGDLNDPKTYMWSIGHEEGVDPHIHTPMMLEVQITDGCTADSNSRSGCEAVKCSRGQNTGPGTAMTGDDVGNAGY
jgi:hypothetical protein